MPEKTWKRIQRQLTPRTVLLFLLLIGLTLLSIWLHQLSQPKPAANDHAPAPEPAYYLRNFTLTVTGEEGLPRYTVKSTYMEYLSRLETFRFREPLFFFSQQQDGVWAIRSEEARIVGRGEWIRMEGGVVIEHRTNKRSSLRLKTPTLLILPERKLAESSAPVTLTYPKATIDAVGLRLDLAHQRFELLHQVRGNYHAPPH